MVNASMHIWMNYQFMEKMILAASVVFAYSLADLSGRKYVIQLNEKGRS